MASVYKSGLMALAMKDSGRITELTAMASLSMSMEIFMKETGLTTRQMDMELIFM